MTKVIVLEQDGTQVVEVQFQKNRVPEINYLSELATSRDSNHGAKHLIKIVKKGADYYFVRISLMRAEWDSVDTLFLAEVHPNPEDNIQVVGDDNELKISYPDHSIPKTHVENKEGLVAVVSFEKGKAIIDTNGIDKGSSLVFDALRGIGEMRDKVVVKRFEGVSYSLIAEITPLGAIYSEHELKMNGLKIYTN